MEPSKTVRAHNINWKYTMGTTMQMKIGNYTKTKYLLLKSSMKSSKEQLTIPKPDSRSLQKGHQLLPFNCSKPFYQLFAKYISIYLYIYIYIYIYISIYLYIYIYIYQEKDNKIISL